MINQLLTMTALSTFMLLYVMSLHCCSNFFIFILHVMTALLVFVCVLLYVIFDIVSLFHA